VITDQGYAERAVRPFPVLVSLRMWRWLMGRNEGLDYYGVGQLLTEEEKIFRDSVQNFVDADHRAGADGRFSVSILRIRIRH
jgi:hypothetical protein